MNDWGSWSNVHCFEIGVSSQVRSARTAGDGHWSYLGTDVPQIAAGQATMNLDRSTMKTVDSECYRVVRSKQTVIDQVLTHCLHRRCWPLLMPEYILLFAIGHLPPS
jgi:hypothetical protein